MLYKNARPGFLKYYSIGRIRRWNLTGIERFSYEILTRLDNFPQAKHIAIFIPQNAKQLPELKNISIRIALFQETEDN